jgi:hypothetical protein
VHDANFEDEDFDDDNEKFVDDEDDYEIHDPAKLDAIEQRRRSHTDPILIAVLANGGSRKEAATRAGVSKRTVERRLKDDEFVAKLEAAQAKTVNEIAIWLRSTAPEAVQKMHELMYSAPPSVQLSAARSLMTMHLKYHELYVLERRLDALEEDVRRSHEQGWP